MSYERKPGVLSVWRNKRKKSETQPDFSSNNLVLPGVEGEWEVSLWGPKRSRNGEDYFSVVVKPAWKPTGERPEGKRPVDTLPPSSGYTGSSTGYVGGDDDDTPF